MSPSIGVIVPTRDRRELLYQTLASIRDQDYAGNVTTLVVFDHAEPDESHQKRITELGATWIPSDRDRGLAATRNAGITALDTDLIAFCDDDDTWEPEKLRRQVELLEHNPAAGMVTCSISVRYHGRTTPRLAGTDLIRHQMLLRSRMAMLHSSTFLFRRSFLLYLGMVNESVPAGQGEDWDLLLRATREGRTIPHLDESLVNVLWGRTSFFTYEYDTKVTALNWMMDQHPELRSDPRAHARILGQQAYWLACAGEQERSQAVAKLARSEDWLQWRAYLSEAVSHNLVSGERILAVLHKVGRAI